MNEDVLQYLWKFKQFRSLDFYTTDNQKLEIIEFGEWNKNAGPYFLFAKIKMDNLVFVGHVEIHVRASDWILHQHKDNPDFSNLILHVVYDNNCSIPELENQHIPTLELKNYIDPNLIEKHTKINKYCSFIACEELFDVYKIPIFFSEEAILKRLDDKSILLERELERCHNNYEELLFRQLAYAFGLKVNSDVFLQISELVDFTVINKIKQNQLQLESLFFGLSNWLNDDELDEQGKLWNREYRFLNSKFNLPKVRFNPKFSKLRPPNFPTLRWSQFAHLYSSQPSLFSKLIFINDINELFKVFENIKASEYWDNHFTFGKESKRSFPKKLSKDFINLIMINAVLPMIYFYHKNNDSDINDKILEFYKSIKAEKNSVLDKWVGLGLNFENSLQTQAFLYQYKSFCSHKNCLNCSIGFNILKDDK